MVKLRFAFALALSSAPVVWMTLARGALAQQAELKNPSRIPSSGGGSPPVIDRFELVAQEQTYLQLFRRALLPGPNGSLVTADTASPVTEYLSIRARDIDSPWRRDSVDVELGAWARAWPTSSRFEQPFDGDLQTANLGYRAGPVTLRLGRQVAAGGAARFARFDGLMISGALPSGLFGAAYAGWVVLPRYDARPGYHLLGAQQRQLFPEQELQQARGAHWLSGARLGYQSAHVTGSASFHEQRESGGVERRNVGLDGVAAFSDAVGAGGSLLLELDQGRMADGRLWIALEPHPSLSVTLEAARTKPGLFLSRQSVLSVFSTQGYDELGGFFSWQTLRWLRLETNGYVEAYDSGRPGARAETLARFELGGTPRLLARVGYGRVVVGQLGYHSFRASLARDLARRLAATFDLYAYFYDREIEGYRTSSVYSTTLAYALLDQLELSWGASLARSPYSSLDAQTLLRLSYELDSGASTRGRSR